jgi:hypothetical protein
MIDPVSGMDMSQFAAPPQQRGSDVPPGTPIMRVTPQPAQAKGVDPVSGIDFDQSQFPPIPAPPVKATAGGMMRNIGAGLQEGAAGTMNFVSDPFGNSIGKIVPTAAVFAHDVLAPHFGGRRFTDEERNQLLGDTVPQPGTRVVNAIDTAGGAPTPEQVPAVGPERAVRAGVAGAAGMAGLGPAGPVLNAAMGAGGALAADQVEQSPSIPEYAKPIASLAANVAGNAAVGGGAAAASKVGGGGARIGGNLGIGPKEMVGNTKATSAQMDAIGQQLLHAAGPEGQDALAAATAQPGMGATDQPIPNFHPTTAQAMAGEGVPPQGIAEMDKAARVANPVPFNERATAHNNALVNVVRNPAGDIPDTAEPAMLGQYFTKQLQDIDAQHAGDLAAGQRTIAQAGEQAAQQTSSAVQGITRAVGGTTAPDVTGQAIRTSLTDRNASARAAESKLWGEIDPEGKLALPLGTVQQTARSLMKDIDPNLGDQLGPQESLILKGAAALPDVVPFKDAQRLRSNIGQAERTLRATPGNEQSLRRLGLLKSSLDDAITNGVDAVGRGNDQTGVVGGSNVLGHPGSGDLGSQPGSDQRSAAPVGVPERVRGPGENQQVGGPPAGNSQVAAPAATQGTAGRLRQAETLTDFLISRGGVKDQGGEMRAADLQTVHHQMGGRLINNTRGMPLDYAREAAAEAGFIRPNADLNEFLDAVTSQKPVHRISDAADAALAARQAREAALTSHARLNAGANIDDAVQASGVRLSPAEQEHAIDLHMQGMDPADAVQQAARAGEENILQRNAEYNAVGSPGVPLAARQAEMPQMRPQGVAPNFNADAAGRYSAARQSTLERKQTFGQGPVGAVLRPGRQGAEFNVENAAVARQFLTGNFTEPARVQAFKDAVGGEPQAVDAMREALVSDLRQRRIINEEGMVQPDRLNAWLQPEARGRTVDLFPGLREQLGSAEAAQRTYDQTVADHVARLDAFNKQAAADHIAEVTAFKKTGGQFVASEPIDALKRLFASKTRTQDFQDVVNQAKGNPDVLDGLKRLTADYIEQRFSGAKPSGDDTDFLKAAQFRKFIDERREPLKVIFGGQGIQNLEMVAAKLRQQAAASAMPATPGSDTAQKLSGLAKMGMHAGGAGMATTAFAVVGEHLMEHLGSLATHSPIVAAVAAPVGIIGGLLANTLRQAAIKTRADLIREAMLNPALAKELMTRATASKALSQMSQRRIARAIQAATINNAIGQSNQESKK